MAELERICSLNRMCRQVVIIELERDIGRSGSIFFRRFGVNINLSPG